MAKMTTDPTKIMAVVDSLTDEQAMQMRKIIRAAMPAIKPFIQTLISAISSVLDEEQRALLLEED